jgi:photosystem II stability/assembly factor-like uncharacterized protein
MTHALSKSARAFLFTLITLPVVSVATSGSQKEIVEARPPLLRSVRFVDDTHGWIAGYNGVFYTDDGGSNWRRLRFSLGSIAKFPITVATNVGHVVWADSDGAIFTNDAGLTDVSIRPLESKSVPIAYDPRVYMSSIEFADRKQGFASGSIAHQVFRTTDGGLSWETFDTPADDILAGVFVASSTEVWVVGLEGIVLHTTDSGRSWSHKILKSWNGEPATGLRSISFIDSMRGWICGPSGSIFHTVNGGKNWLRQKTPFAEDLPITLNAVSFANESEGWVVGEHCVNYVEEEYQGVVLHTTDGGRHWDRQPINLAQCLLDVQALPGGRAWAVGQQGAVIRTSDHGRHWTSAHFGRDAQTIAFAARQ